MKFNDNTFLAKQLKAGKESAYEFLMDTYYKPLCAYAYSLTNDVYLSEDIVQNVLVKVWNKKEKINPQLSIKSYLYKSVYNEFIDTTRKTKSISILQKKHIEGLVEVVENESNDIEKLIKILNQEIEKLPIKCKRVFLMNKKEGLTYTEISEYLNISTKTVEGHMTRAMKLLNEKLRGNISTFILSLVFDPFFLKKHQEVYLE